jgi:hypothetical protein
MSTKSRESIYGSSIRHSAERAAAARKAVDRLAREAWNQRMLGYKGPAQPSPALGDGYPFNRSLRHRTALAQTNRTELKRGDLTGTDKEITIGLLEAPSGSTIDRQTHLGEEAVYV